MKANLRLIRKGRRYSEDFKKSLVKDFESGKFSVPQLEKLHGVANVSIYRWIYKYSTFNEKGFRVVEASKSSKQKLSEYESKIKELEAALGRKQIQIDFLEELVNVANEQYDCDLKKNFSTPSSKESKTKRKWATV